MVLLVDVNSRTGFDESAEKIKGALLGALQFLGKSNCFVEVSLLDKKEMARINKRTRGKEGPTAVLSFEEPADIPRVEDEPRQLGEIYLAPEVIKEKGMNPVRVAVHGLLHLLGYTHRGRSDTMKMEDLEDRIEKAVSY